MDSASFLDTSTSTELTAERSSRSDHDAALCGPRHGSTSADNALRVLPVTGNQAAARGRSDSDRGPRGAHPCQIVIHAVLAWREATC